MVLPVTDIILTIRKYISHPHSVPPKPELPQLNGAIFILYVLKIARDRTH